MDLLEHTAQWAKGDMLQGRIMLGIGLLLLVAAVAIFKSNHLFFKGTLIPLGLLLVIMMGYGGFLAFTRPGHLQKVELLARENPQEAFNAEHAKAEKDNKAYTMLKPIWIGLILVTAGLYFVFPTYYLKGLSAGLISLFLAVFIIDSALHYRLAPYLQALSEFIKSSQPGL